MEVIKTLVGKHLANLFTENVAFKIAEFLEIAEEEIKEAERRYDRRMKICEYMRRSFLRRGSRHAFGNYTRNLRFDDEGICNYVIRIVELDWIKITVKREGRRSFGNSKQQSYATKELADDWGFTEIK